jgi:hypothetical protein
VPARDEPRSTSPVSRIRDFANTVNNTIRRPDAIQYVTRTERPSKWKRNSRSFPSSCRVYGSPSNGPRSPIRST